MYPKKQLTQTGYLFALFLFLFLAIFPSQGQASDLYAILVGDTRDVDLGSSVQ